MRRYIKLILLLALLFPVSALPYAEYELDATDAEFELAPAGEISPDSQSSPYDGIEPTLPDESIIDPSETDESHIENHVPRPQDNHTTTPAPATVESMASSMPDTPARNTGFNGYFAVRYHQNALYVQPESDGGDINLGQAWKDDGWERFGFGWAIGVRNPYTRFEFEYLQTGLINSAVIYESGAIEQFKSSVETMMLNAYLSAPLWLGMSPYIGGGIGIATIDLGNNFQYMAPGLIIARNINVRENNFAWQAMAGVEVALVRSYTFDIGYRIADYGRIEGNINSTLGTTRYDYAFKARGDLYLGLKFGQNF